ncbi:MAG: mannonate dehydratase [Trueperaceae bacterium]
MKLALHMNWQPDRRWRLARQLGVRYAIPTGWMTRPASGPMPWSYERLREGQQRFADAGFELPVIGSPPLNAVRLGTDGAEREFDDLAEQLDAMGRLGIPVLCYNWMPLLHAVRTSARTPGRGGALVTSYDHALMADAPWTETGQVGDDLLWDTFRRFLERVVPLAESAGVTLALHPDDPPISPIRGLARIFRSVDALEAAVASVPSPANALTFCQGTIATMGGDVIQAIHRLGARGAIAFVHFRDVRGTAERFVETFHDEGPTDMYAALEAYRAVGFDGPLRPDHAPAMDGEGDGEAMYEDLGRLYAVGYIRGLLEGVDRERA